MAVALNLVAENGYEILIMNYLQGNLSEQIAEKINNGTPIEKDGKPLLSKKDLKGCIDYIKSLARKEAQSGVAMIKDEIVYGWAVKYFEDDSIEGKLYNEDGTEYIKVQKQAKAPKNEEDEDFTDGENENRFHPQRHHISDEEVALIKKGKKESSPQLSLFDILG